MRVLVAPSSLAVETASRLVVVRGVHGGGVDRHSDGQPLQSAALSKVTCGCKRLLIDPVYSCDQ